MTPVAASSDQPEHLDAVDALRGLAFLCVLHVHTAQSYVAWSHPAGPPGPFFRLAQAGAYGVSLFFIASAFTLFASHRQRLGRESSPVAAFFVRRIFRILPLFWAGIAFYFFLYGTWNRNWAEGSLGIFHFGLTFLVLHGWHPDTINSVVPGGWSIAAECTFYALAPWLFAWLTTFRRAATAYVLALGAAIALNHFARAGLAARLFPSVPAWRQASFTYLWFPAHLPTFLLGFAVYHARPYIERRSRAARHALLAGNAALLLGAGFWLHNDAADYVFPFLLAGFVALLLANPARWLVNRFTCVVGTVSFSAYITHFAAVKVFERLLAHAPSLSPALGYAAIYLPALALTLGASTLTYRLIEKPGMALGRRLVRRYFSSPVPVRLTAAA